MFKRLLELLKPKKQLKADVSKSLTSHRCPVCNGNGLVPNGFYTQTSGHWSTNSITPETCRSCGGTGIVGRQCLLTAVSGSCFGRISESVFNELKSLDDLIIKMGTTKDGYKIGDVGEPDNFKYRMKHFKRFLKKELPEFSDEDILKFDKHFQKFRKIYEWKGAEYFLTAMEFESRNNFR